MLVVCFHLGIGAMGSGFLGVDVFFVISGFLMAILFQSGNAGDFIKRRAKRLLPAYFATVIAVLLASVFRVLPSELAQTAEQSIFASFFASNFGYWLQNSYFNKTEFNPLLHLWSLGVEIQFYLIVPLLAWFFKKSKLWMPLILVGSLGLCFLMVAISPKTSFFMMPLRLWEFLLGYAAAVYYSSAGNVKLRGGQWAGAAALLFIFLIPLLPVEGTRLSVWAGHPGLAALAVCIAAAAVLIFGLPTAFQNSLAGAVLERLGKYSYAVYLAHFPVIVLYLYQPFSGTILTPETAWGFVALVGLIALFSAALFKLVEEPARKLNPSPSRVAFGSASILVIAAAVYMSPAWLYTESELQIFKALTDRSQYRCGLEFRIKNPTKRSCRITGAIASPRSRILLVGNSHADSIKTAFAATAAEQGHEVYFLTANNPLMSGGLSAGQVLDEARSLGIDTLVLHFSPDGITPQVVQNMVANAEVSGMKTALILPIPVYDESVPKLLWQSHDQGKPLPKQTLHDYHSANAAFLSGVAALANHSFKSYETASSLCMETCALTDSRGNPTYFDGGHLTLSGSRMLTPIFRSILEQSTRAERGTAAPAGINMNLWVLTP